MIFCSVLSFIVLMADHRIIDHAQDPYSNRSHIHTQHKLTRTLLSHSLEILLFVMMALQFCEPFYSKFFLGDNYKFYNYRVIIIIIVVIIIPSQFTAKASSC